MPGSKGAVASFVGLNACRDFGPIQKTPAVHFDVEVESLYQLMNAQTGRYSGLSRREPPSCLVVMERT